MFLARNLRSGHIVRLFQSLSRPSSSLAGDPPAAAAVQPRSLYAIFTDPRKTISTTIPASNSRNEEEKMKKKKKEVKEDSKAVVARTIPASNSRNEEEKMKKKNEVKEDSKAVVARTIPDTKKKDPAKKKKEIVVNGGPTPWPEEKDILMELPAEASSLVKRLHEKGYLNCANFIVNFDPERIPRDAYTRSFLKSAAVKFGRDHQDIANSLCSSDLKKVALFGCPSLEKGAVMSAKRLRSFFKIQEEIICRGCVLKGSCRLVNKEGANLDKVHVDDVMRLLAMYSLETVAPQLPVPDDLKVSVSKLLEEVVNLSESGNEHAC